MMLWIKAFHIIAMVSWFAGLLYLPRLFVYHSNIDNAENKSDVRFCTMERRLYWAIMTPSAIITLILGLALVHKIGISFKTLPLWLQLKLALVSLLICFHVYCGIIVRQFHNHKQSHTTSFYRWFNEFPTFILIGIVLLVVLKPI